VPTRVSKYVSGSRILALHKIHAGDRQDPDNLTPSELAQVAGHDDVKLILEKAA
jgi:hypothetical protein